MSSVRPVTMSELHADVRYSDEPVDKRAFITRSDRLYSLLAWPYDLAVKLIPVWTRWLEPAVPHVRGPRVLEVSFGTGWLLTRYAGEFDSYGVDLSERMVRVAQRNLRRVGLTAHLLQANVEALPYPDEYFDTIVNTMAFSGYPDGDRAMAELHRMLRPGGRIVMIDIGYPHNGSRVGSAVVWLWKRTGDVIRDMPQLFERFGFDVAAEEVGGLGSVQLYVATKR